MTSQLPVPHLFDKAGGVSTAALASDAEGALAAARANPRVDPSRLFVWGWSFSSPAAAALAARDPGLAGLVLLGALSSTSRDYFVSDYTEVALPYLRRLAPDGKVTADTLQQAFTSNGGFFARGVSHDFAGPNGGDTVKVNPFFDANGDGVLEIDAEIVPKLGDWVDADTSGYIANNLRALPSVGEQAPNIHIPTLILQGERDAAARLSGAQGLDAAFAGNPRYTFKLYRDPLDNPTVAACDFDPVCLTQAFELPTVREELYAAGLNNYKTILTTLLAANSRVRILALNTYELDDNDPYHRNGHHRCA